MTRTPNVLWTHRTFASTFTRGLPDFMLSTETRLKNVTQDRPLSAALRHIGSVFGLLVLVMTIPIAYGILVQLYPALTVVYGPEAGLLWVGGVQYIGYGFMGVLVCRYLSRLAPRPFSLRTNRSQPSITFTAPFAVNVAICFALTNVITQPSGVTLPTLTFDVVLVGAVLYHYSTARLRCLSNGTALVLFLRPFLSFSDRSLVTGVLNMLPANTQAVFLVPRNEPARAWDPYTLALAGFRLFEPMRSAPLSLVCDEGEWMACVEFLIQRSSVIVIDLSLVTPSLAAELSLIRKVGAGTRTIAFKEQPDDSNTVGDDPGAAATEFPVFWFRRQVRPARMCLALVMAASTFFAFWLRISMEVTPSLSVRVLLLVVTGVFVVRYWSVVFLKKSISRRVFQSARTAVKALVLKGSTKPFVFTAKVCATIAVASFIRVVGLGIYSRHVVVGDHFPVSATVRLLGATGSDDDSIALIRRIPDLRDMANWEFAQPGLELESLTVRVSRERTRWWKSAPFSANAIFFRMRGTGRVASVAETGEADLSFSIPSDGLPRLVQPSALIDRWPIQPVTTNARYYWLVREWIVHHDRRQAMSAALRQIIGALGVLAGIVAGLAAVFWVLKQ